MLWRHSCHLKEKEKFGLIFFSVTRMRTYKVILASFRKGKGKQRKYDLHIKIIRKKTQQEKK